MAFVWTYLYAFSLTKAADLNSFTRCERNAEASTKKINTNENFNILSSIKINYQLSISVIPTELLPSYKLPS